MRLKYTLFLLLPLYLMVGCKSSKNLISEKNPEDFDVFYDRFHQDEDFQMSRLKFPLEGSSEDVNGQRTWTPQNWHLMKVKIYDVDTDKYKTDYKKTDTSFTQKFWLPGSGFMAEYRFKRIEGKWFLVYARDTNL